MQKTTLTIENQTIELPIITGTMNEKAIDISELRKKSVLLHWIRDIRIPEVVLVT